MESEAEGSAAARVVFGIFMVMGVTFVAIEVPGIASVISLLGATCATAMMYFIPAYCLHVAMPSCPANTVKKAALILFGLVSFASVPVTVAKMMGVQIQ